jgi:hypothetical protein
MSAPDRADFLLARIAEDEATAQRATGAARPDWVVGCEETGDGENAFWAVEALGEASEWFADLGSQTSDADRAAHIARWDPARVLAEYEAKRQIVQGCRDQADLLLAMHMSGTYGPADLAASAAASAALWAAVAHLALPFADHADYRAEWAL